jgi:Holliday junction resolvasome RuvABC endonuclease subunit
VAKQADLFAPPTTTRAPRPGPRKVVALAPSKPLAPAPGPLMTRELGGWQGDITDQLSGKTRRGPGWWFTPRELPNVLAIDPGVRTGWALATPGGDIASGVIRDACGDIGAAWSRDVSALVCDACGVDKPAPLLVVVEDTFLHVERPDPQATMSVARRVGYVAGLAAIRGLPVWRVLASEWQRRLIGRLSRDAGKARAVEVASKLVGAEVTSDHEADAILLCAYARGAHAPLRRRGAST